MGEKSVRTLFTDFEAFILTVADDIKLREAFELKQQQRRKPYQQSKNPLVTDNTIRTSLDGRFDFANPKPEDIHIEDIATGLSNTCRFAGQLDRFYSVAEHCVHCFHVAEKSDQLSQRSRIAVFMHDAAEAYCGDMVKPLKIMLPEYKKIEDRIQRAVEKRFYFSNVPVVKTIDLILLKAEKSAMSTQDCGHDLSAIEDHKIDFEYWSPKEARREFLLVAEELGIGQGSESDWTGKDSTPLEDVEDAIEFVMHDVGLRSTPFNEYTKKTLYLVTNHALSRASGKRSCYVLSRSPSTAMALATKEFEWDDKQNVDVTVVCGRSSILDVDHETLEYAFSKLKTNVERLREVYRSIGTHPGDKP